MHSSKSKSSAKKLKKVKRTASGKNFLNRIVPGYTSIIVDTNCLIGDLEIVKKVIQSEKWVVIVPSIGIYICLVTLLNFFKQTTYLS